jgi:membrane protease YdiL (CAAX protease family)
MIDQILNSPQAILCFALGYFSLAFMVYFFSSGSRWLRHLALKLGDDPAEPETRIYLERVLGFLLLGAIPALIFSLVFKLPLSTLGLNIPFGQTVWIWWLVPVLLFLAFSALRPAKGVNIAFYPQVRKRDWTAQRVLINALFWILYLVGYEFAFRGWLFFTCLHAFGLWPAVMINCAIYGLSHIPKGVGEAFGALIMGVGFCLIAYFTNSFLIVFVVHIILAVGNDLKAVAANREMRFTR